MGLDYNRDIILAVLVYISLLSAFFTNKKQQKRQKKQKITNEQLNWFTEIKGRKDRYVKRKTVHNSVNERQTLRFMLYTKNRLFYGKQR